MSPENFEMFIFAHQTLAQGHLLPTELPTCNGNLKTLLRADLRSSPTLLLAGRTLAFAEHLLSSLALWRRCNMHLHLSTAQEVDILIPILQVRKLRPQ